MPRPPGYGQAARPALIDVVCQAHALVPDVHDARWLASGRAWSQQAGQAPAKPPTGGSLPAVAGPADGADRQRPRLTESFPREARPIGHDHRDAVEHVYQACFELLFPAVLGQPGRKAVHRGEMPGVDLARRVD